MNVAQKKKRPLVFVLERDYRIIEIVNNLGPCSTSQVHHALVSDQELLLVMRAMHHLVERGLLERVTINDAMLYKTKSNYKSIRPYFMVRTKSEI